MFKVLEMMDFCIRLRTSLLFGPNNLCSTASSSHDQPPRTSIIMLCCSTVYPLYCCFSSHLNGPYFKVFSSSFGAWLSIQGQLISSVSTCLDLWLIIWASTILALTSWQSAYTGTSQNTCTLLFSYTGFGLTGNTRVAPHQLASDLVVAQKTESSRPHYVSKDIYSRKIFLQPRREGHSLETYRTICK